MVKIPTMKESTANAINAMKSSGFTRLALTVALFTNIFGASPAPAGTVLQQVKTVFVIALENHNFTQPSSYTTVQQISNNPAAPYLNSLITPGSSNAAQVSFATKYYNSGVGVHPSEPNYVWAEGGSNFGDAADNDPSAASANVFTNNHLTRQLKTAGIAWKNYQEDVQLSASPTNSASGTSATTINPYYGTGQYNYGVKHNPMAFYADTQTQNVFAFTNFLKDLTNNAVGRYNWITPNQYNDMHSALAGGFTYHGTNYTGDQAAVAQGDNFLSIVIPKIMAAPAYQDHGMILLWWDETEGGDNTNYTITEILISPLAKGNAYASNVEMNHSSDIKTMEEIFGLAYLSNSIPTGDTAASGTGYNNVATVNDLGDLLLATPNIVGGKLLPGAGGFQLTFSGPAGQSYHVLASNDPTMPESAWPVLGSNAFGSTNAIFTDISPTNYFGRYYVIKSP
jgi:hypothetical protein